MQEVTRVFTVQMTFIAQGEAGEEIDKDTAAELLKNDIKSMLGCDDVTVEQVQDFVLDK